MAKPGISGITPADWEQINPGKGKPSVKHEGGLTIVTYPTGEIVKSHKTLKDYGDVTLNLGNHEVTVPIAMVWKFHGQPCETESIRFGGKGYEKE